MARETPAPAPVGAVVRRLAVCVSFFSFLFFFFFSFFFFLFSVFLASIFRSPLITLILDSQARLLGLA